MRHHRWAQLIAAILVLGGYPVAQASGADRGSPAPPILGAGAESQQAVRISGGYVHSCLLTPAGGVRCWGTNWFGELGNDGYGVELSPVDVVGLSSGVQDLGVGAQSSCVLTQRGGVKCWGWNTYGEVGDGTVAVRKAPVDVVGLSSGVRAIAVGEFFACALTDAGGVKCWGRNINRGTLGDGTLVDRAVPGDVVGLTHGVRAIAAASDHACALREDGGLVCWGANHQGEVGDATTTLRSTPTAVVGLNGPVRQIALGSVHSCAIVASGDVQCWGGNWNGQLGDGTTQERHTPVTVAGLPGPAHAITAAGTGSTCVLVGAGTPLCWGLNSFGQLGDGTTQNRLTPTPVRGLPHELLMLDLGPGAQACAVTVSGGALCWGFNDYGALGDGTQDSRSRPGPVTGYEPPALVAPLPIEGGTLVAPTDGLAVVVPAGTLTTTATLVHSLVTPLAQPPVGSLAAVGPAFSLLALGTDTGDRLSPTQAFTLTLHYAGRPLGPVHEDHLALYAWSGTGWVREPNSRLDLAAQQVTALPTGFGLWALLGETAAVFLPTLIRR